MNARFHFLWLAILAALIACRSGQMLYADRPAWTTSQLQGSPEPPSPYKIESAFPGVKFARPTSVEEIPGANRILVTELGGKIFSFDKKASVKEVDLIADLAEFAGGSATIFHATVDPGFLQNRNLFVCYVHPDGGPHTRVSRFTLTDDPAPKIQSGSERVVLTWPTGGHNGGCLKFGKDGYLYISTGDGSGPSPPDQNTVGQDVSNLLGSILRIDVNRSSGEQSYSIPSDNPFIELPGARPEVWAYGLRNPWKFGIDAKTGDIFAADNGYETWESIHRIERGGNSGWPIMEGRAILRSEVKRGPTPITPPVKDHPHTEANSVIGGPVYRGSKIADLDGTFIYGDYITGTIWGLKRNGDVYSHRTLVDTDLRITSFGVGSGGEIYVLDHDFTGQIYELLPSGLEDNSAAFPRRLSQTGLFASVQPLIPAAGVMPYDVRVQRWKDGANSQRWVAIPGQGSITLSTDEETVGEFPNGTAFVKQLTLPQGDGDSIRLETQVLHYENGRWQQYSYLWDEDGSDAMLVDSRGTRRTLEIRGRNGDSDERTWQVSASNECKLCHNAAAGYVLGFRPNQLDFPSRESKDNVLAKLVSDGVISSDPLANPSSRLVDPHDESVELNDRARSYLHGNCAMCHHPRGVATVGFYLRRDLPFESLQTNRGTGIGTFGMQNARVIAPGDPYRSIVLYRMAKLGYSHMPYIGTRTVDSRGVALIAQWIRSLEPDDPGRLSPPVVKGSTESDELESLVVGSGHPGSDRSETINQLIGSSEGALALATELHAGNLRAADAETAIALGYNAASSDVRGLFEHFVPESKRRATLGPNADPQAVLALNGNAARGKLIFYSDDARCRNCHHATDPSESTGPTLSDISKNYQSRLELLTHVFQPSLKIDEKYATYLAVTDAGQVTSGLKIRESDERVVLKTAEGKLVTIESDEIEQLRKSPKSIMPEGVLSDLTAQEAADLVEFIVDTK